MRHCNKTIVIGVLRDVALVGLTLAETVDGSSADQGEGFRVLVREQLPRLYSLARRLVGDEAEDAVQDCLLKAYQRLHQLQGGRCAGVDDQHPGQLLP